LAIFAEEVFDVGEAQFQEGVNTILAAYIHDNAAEVE
jgi:hypothetical protein